jgi:BspA type Leucine rich repeat region (6 copies)
MANLTIGNNVTGLGPLSFINCYGLTSVIVPDSVTAVGYAALTGCSNLRNFVFGNGVQYIGSYVFNGCGSLTNIILGNNVSIIADNAFDNCSLISITIPKSVTNIGGTFNYCPKLTGVYFQGNAPAIGSVLFYGNNNVIAYYLPGASGWSSSFAGIPAMLWNPLAQTSDASFGVQSNQFGFNITGTTNIPVVVEACTNLGGGAWVTLQSMSLTNGSSYFSDPQWTNYPGRFYRLRSPF